MSLQEIWTLVWKAPEFWVEKDRRDFYIIIDYFGCRIENRPELAKGKERLVCFILLCFEGGKIAIAGIPWLGLEW